jgi:hypothetical protein
MKATPVIYVFKEDSRPYLQVRVVDAQNNTAMDLSLSTTTARMLLRKVGSATTIANIPMTKIADGVTGQLYHSWVDDAAANVLESDDVEVNQRYEGQIVIDFDGSEQTVNTVVRIQVKERFAEVV